MVLAYNAWMTQDKKTKPLTYQDAGVDIEKAGKLVEDIKRIAKKTDVRDRPAE